MSPKYTLSKNKHKNSQQIRYILVKHKSTNTDNKLNTFGAMQISTRTTIQAKIHHLEKNTKKLYIEMKKRVLNMKNK